ncbi:hypothetical protein BJ508DRAFT_16088 [Ascobolus immersus RN42]|uniref:Uncharacterized protein n=1 Tax=Ascobolus immersus RN42 TaxID=1160509 RepID=A0A3N4HPK3_ASCIM|nr:hypothetical protein BJ508DRAFT_16088 [Ascobolus immersus RN42]
MQTRTLTHKREEQATPRHPYPQTHSSPAQLLRPIHVHIPVRCSAPAFIAFPTIKPSPQFPAQLQHLSTPPHQRAPDLSTTCPSKQHGAPATIPSKLSMQRSRSKVVSSEKRPRKLDDGTKKLMPSYES